jgi:hypothetical protein
MLEIKSTLQLCTEKESELTRLGHLRSEIHRCFSQCRIHGLRYHSAPVSVRLTPRSCKMEGWLDRRGPEVTNLRENTLHISLTSLISRQNGWPVIIPDFSCLLVAPFWRRSCVIESMSDSNPSTPEIRIISLLAGVDAWPTGANRWSVLLGRGRRLFVLTSLDQ